MRDGEARKDYKKTYKTIKNKHLPHLTMVQRGADYTVSSRNIKTRCCDGMGEAHPSSFRLNARNPQYGHQ